MSTPSEGSGIDAAQQVRVDIPAALFAVDEVVLQHERSSGTPWPRMRDADIEPSVVLHSTAECIGTAGCINQAVRLQLTKTSETLWEKGRNASCDLVTTAALPFASPSRAMSVVFARSGQVLLL